MKSDKDILGILGWLMEAKGSQANLKKAVGRVLAARVLKSWV